MDLSLVVAFAIAQLTLSLMPGPAVLLTTSIAIRRGMVAALSAIAGVLFGNAVYIAASCAGLGAALSAEPRLLKLISIAGAAYLAWIALGLLMKSLKQPQSSAQGSVGALWPNAETSPPFKSALLLQLSNPKSILFFGAMLPQFAARDGWAPAVQMAALGVLAVLIELPILAAYAWLAHKAGAAGRLGGRWMNLSAGLILLAAAGLAATR